MEWEWQPCLLCPELRTSIPYTNRLATAAFLRPRLDRPAHARMAASGPTIQATSAASTSSAAAGSAQNKSMGHSAPGSRHSPVTPLAPLEYLQNQRRGSITDPSLHAGPQSHSHSVAGNTLSPSFRHLDSGPGAGHPASPTPPDPHRRGSLAHPRPDSPYKFGDASAQPDGAHGHGRRHLRSPSSDAMGKRTQRNGALSSADGNSAGGSGEHGRGKLEAVSMLHPHGGLATADRL